MLVSDIGGAAGLIAGMTLATVCGIIGAVSSEIHC